MSDFRDKVIKMSQYLDVEGIASHFNTSVEIVQKILAGEDIDIEKEESGKESIYHVSANYNVQRQRVIAVWRAKGGVGTTVTAINLARMISERVKTLFICLNFAEGGSDIVHYLDLPYYPISSAVIKGGLHYTEIQNNFFVLNPVTKLDHDITPEDIRELIINARQEFDVIVLDLPNSMDKAVLEAVKSSTTVVFVVQGLNQEIKRLNRLSGMVASKEVIYLANGVNSEALAKQIHGGEIFDLPYDKSIPERLHSQSPFLPPNSPFYQGLEPLYSFIFDERAQVQKNKRLDFRRLKRKASTLFYGFRPWDRLRDAVYITTCLLVLTAALYSLDVEPVKVAVNKAVIALNHFVKN